MDAIRYNRLNPWRWRSSSIGLMGISRIRLASRKGPPLRGSFFDTLESSKLIAAAIEFKPAGYEA